MPYAANKRPSRKSIIIRHVPASDQVVMRNGLPAMLKPIAGFERQGILPPFFVDQMNALT